MNHSTQNNAEFTYDSVDCSLGVQVSKHFLTSLNINTNEAITEIKKGDQVFISYGTRSDDEMIADYGFCLGLDDGGDLMNSASRIEFGLDELDVAVKKYLKMDQNDIERKRAMMDSMKKDPNSNFIINDMCLWLHKEIINFNLWCYIIFMLGGDMNDVRNMILTDESIPLEKRKTIFEMRKNCFQVFTSLIKSNSLSP